MGVDGSMVYPEKKTISTPRRMDVSHHIPVELPREFQVALFSSWTERSVIIMIEFVRKTEDSFVLSRFFARTHFFDFSIIFGSSLELVKMPMRRFSSRQHIIKLTTET